MVTSIVSNMIPYFLIFYANNNNGRNQTQHVCQNLNAAGAKFYVPRVIIFPRITWNLTFYITGKLLFKIIVENPEFTMVIQWQQWKTTDNRQIMQSIIESLNYVMLFFHFEYIAFFLLIIALPEWKLKVK